MVVAVCPRVAEAAKRPERVIGMHYFSPVDKMPLLEIITHEGTSKDAAALATSVGLKQGKTVIVVKDVPGFFVNRCLGPFMVEAIALLQDGVPVEKLDKTMKGFGLPVGPITLADEVGIDVAAHVAEFMGDKIGNRMDVRSVSVLAVAVRLWTAGCGCTGCGCDAVDVAHLAALASWLAVVDCVQQGADPAAMQSMVKAGLFGRKTGKGFYTYGPGKARNLNPEVAGLLKPFIRSDAGATFSNEVITDRMMLRFMNEAFYCLQDDIITGPVDGDIGSVFGMGFPPFLGGPFRYCDQLCAQAVVDKMNKYADEVGPHFAPAQILVDLAKSGGKFHPRD